MPLIDLQPGPQRAFAEARCDVVLFGGAAGGGKTRAVVHEMAKYVDVGEYTAVIFRRTYPELKGPGGILDETRKVYPHLGGVLNETALTWRFPSGAQIQLASLQHEKDTYRWQGRQLCAVAFDEATHFSEGMFWYLWSRLRTTSGVPLRFLLTCNPDPDSWLLDWVRPYLSDGGSPGPTLSGKVRYFARVSGKLVWWDDKDSAPPTANSFVFIPSQLSDNPILVESDPTYRQKLLALPPVEQARLLAGNWLIRPSSGSYFQRGWFPVLQPTPDLRAAIGQPRRLEPTTVGQWRSWDLAATPVDGCLVPGAPVGVRAELRRDADWTRSCRFSRWRDGRVLWDDLVSARDTPGAIEWLIRRTAEQDGKAITQVFWQDPGQAGVHQETTLRRLLNGYKVVFCRTVNPIEAARVASREVYGQRVVVTEDTPWYAGAMHEMESFPDGQHDDIVSAFALGCLYWLDAHSTSPGRTVALNGPTQELYAPLTVRFRDY